MKMINHHHVVSVKDVFATSAKIFIVLEFVGGGELFDKIANEGKLPEEKARFYFKQLVEGLSHCHNNGVCHRDLKPEVRVHLFQPASCVNLIFVITVADFTALRFFLFFLSIVFKIPPNHPFFSLFVQTTQNLLLDTDGNLKISDFGFSTLNIGDADGDGGARAELLHTTCGTPNYVAPEVLGKDGYDGKRGQPVRYVYCRSIIV